MIKSFKGKDAERVFSGRRPKRLPHEIVRRAFAKLTVLDNATSLDDMRTPPSNKLHKLGGDREGMWAVWVDRQFRLCFRFNGGDAFDVEIVDYHD